MSQDKRRYKSCSDELLDKVVKEIASKKISITKAAKIHNIPKGTLVNKVHKKHAGKIGHPLALTLEEEESIVKHIIVVSEWGFPFVNLDLRYLVKQYLDVSGKQIRQFKNNLPSKNWATDFLKRHKHSITKRNCQNIKTTKASLTPEIFVDYFNNLKKSLTLEDGSVIESTNIYNYDETNLSDDPGTKKCIFKRGVKYAERIRDSTKASTSIMFCGSAAGKLLPPYVVYKAEHLWTPWTEGGPKFTRYNRSRSGWFDATIFADWFLNMFIPSTRHISGRIVLIGDNLSSHFSVEVLKAAEENNIAFICIPKNSTHLAQPLDVAFYAPLKQCWRKILDAWKAGQRKKSQTLTKDSFPRLLKQLYDEVKGPDDVSENLISGFKKSGIVPFNPDAVISRLPHHQTAETSQNNLTVISDVVVNMLKDMRYGKDEQQVRRRRQKINVPAGKSISLEDYEASNSLQNDSAETTSKSSKRKPVVSKNNLTTMETESDSSLEDSDEIPYADSSEGSNYIGSDISDADISPETSKTDNKTDSTYNSNNMPSTSKHVSPIFQNKETTKKSEEKCTEIYESHLGKIEVGNFAIIKFQTHRNTYKFYVGRIEEIKGTEFTVNCLRKKKYKFVFPDIADKSTVDEIQFCKLLSAPFFLKRGFIFEASELNGFNLQ